MKILIYDDKNIMYKVGEVNYISYDNNMVASRFIDGTIAYTEPRTVDMHCTIYNFQELDNITLDETTMKRIAKYNKEAEMKELDLKIIDRQEKIKELDNIIKDKDKRVKKLKDFVANLYDIDVDVDDDNDDWWD